MGCAIGHRPIAEQFEIRYTLIGKTKQHAVSANPFACGGDRIASARPEKSAILKHRVDGAELIPLCSRTQAFNRAKLGRGRWHRSRPVIQIWQTLRFVPEIEL